MINPKPVHLQTPDEVRAQGWLAEARDGDGHLMTVISPEADDASLGQFMRECTADGMTVTAFPQGSTSKGESSNV
jgi:molybdopterin synthase sulfur carrier subunit